MKPVFEPISRTSFTFAKFSERCLRVGPSVTSSQGFKTPGRQPRQTHPPPVLRYTLIIKEKEGETKALIGFFKTLKR